MPDSAAWLPTTDIRGFKERINTRQASGWSGQLQGELQKALFKQDGRAIRGIGSRLQPKVQATPVCKGAPAST